MEKILSKYKQMQFLGDLRFNSFEYEVRKKDFDSKPSISYFNWLIHSVTTK